MHRLGNKIRRIVRVNSGSYTVTLEFSDGAVGVVPLAHLFERPKGLAAEILKGNMFAMCFLENGALAWPNGFELCPDVLRGRLLVTTGKRRTRRPAVRTTKARG